MSTMKYLRHLETNFDVNLIPIFDLGFKEILSKIVKVYFQQFLLQIY